MSVITRSARNLNNKTRSTLRLSQPEPIIGDSTWRSPGNFVVEVDPTLTENINYTGGSAVYTGLDDIQIQMTATITTEATGGSNTTVLMTGGIQGNEDLNQVIEHLLTNGNEAKELTCQFVSNWSNGQTLDFFINADKNIDLKKGEWIIKRYDC